MTATIRRISAVADYVQFLCGYLAANEALEPAHAVLFDLLCTGADFERAAASNPIHLAAGAIKHLCSQPDVDGTLGKKKPAADRNPQRPTPYPKGYCFNFQVGKCTRQKCSFRHRCAQCHSENHGKHQCMPALAAP